MLKDCGNSNVEYPADFPPKNEMTPLLLSSHSLPLPPVPRQIWGSPGAQKEGMRKLEKEEGVRRETQPCQIFVHLVARKRSPSFCGQLIAPDWRPLPSHDLHLRHRRRLFNVCGGPQQPIAHTLTGCTTAALRTFAVFASNRNHFHLNRFEGFGIVV